MAHNNVEVEIKIPISKRDYLRLQKLLKDKAKFIGSSNDIDMYFNAPHRDFLKLKEPDEYLRIRIKGGSEKGAIAYKRAYRDKTGKPIRVEEHEAKIDGVTEVKKIFSILNFVNFIVIDKKREVYDYKRKFEISLDNVKNLGYFVEIESKKDFGGIKVTHDKVKEYATELGLDVLKKDYKGYVFLMMKKKGLVRE